MYTLFITCTMLLEQIKGFCHGITEIFLLVGSYTMAGISKDFYIVVQVRIDCGIYITCTLSNTLKSMLKWCED